MAEYCQNAAGILTYFKAVLKLRVAAEIDRFVEFGVDRESLAVVEIDPAQVFPVGTAVRAKAVGNLQQLFVRPERKEARHLMKGNALVTGKEVLMHAGKAVNLTRDARFLTHLALHCVLKALAEFHPAADGVVILPFLLRVARHQDFSSVRNNRADAEVEFAVRRLKGAVHFHPSCKKIEPHYSTACPLCQAVFLLTAAAFRCMMEEA